jgi:hypothetical protein
MKKIILVGLPLVFFVGCTSSNPPFPPEVGTYRTPVDGDTGIRNQHHHNITRGYNKRKVIEPDKWLKQNANPTSWRDQNVEPTPSQEPSS